MARLEWNKITERFFEAGLDQGVLYAPDGSVVPWNGLISITQKSGSDFEPPVYLNGRVVYQNQTPNDFTGTLKAFTYPEAFASFSGFEEVLDGVALGHQLPTKPFGLSWRTNVGNGVEEKVAYKLHILYNVFAVPSSITRDTLTDDSDPELFSWEIRAVPSDAPGFRPTAYLVIDSRKVDKYRLESIEKRLYGADGYSPMLGSLTEFMEYMASDVLIRITDNGDGTWTAEGPDDLVKAYDEQWFSIESEDVTYIDSDTYTISTTEY